MNLHAAINWKSGENALLSFSSQCWGQSKSIIPISGLLELNIPATICTFGHFPQLLGPCVYKKHKSASESFSSFRHTSVVVNLFVAWKLSLQPHQGFLPSFDVWCRAVLLGISCSLQVVPWLVLRLCGCKVVFQKGLNVFKGWPFIRLLLPAQQHHLMKRLGTALRAGHAVSSLYLLKNLSIHHTCQKHREIYFMDFILLFLLKLCPLCSRASMFNKKHILF